MAQVTLLLRWGYGPHLFANINIETFIEGGRYTLEATFENIFGSTRPKMPTWAPIAHIWAKILKSKPKEVELSSLQQSTRLDE